MTMQESKRRKLAAKGWVTGNAEDFLGLSKEEAAYIELRLKLAEGLKSKRQSKGVTQTQLAQTLSSSQSRVAKMESGDPTVSLDLLVKSLLALGTSRRQIASIIAQR
jgi:ribosome-binding protein aMBF1 (putative translation factor)